MKSSGLQKGIMLIIMAAAIFVAVYFGYINRNRSTSEEAIAVGEVQSILMMDLEANYPPTAREVVANFCRIYKALYGEEATQEEITGMGEKLLVLYDEDLIKNQIDYNSSIVQEVNRKKSDGYTLSTYTVQSASEITTQWVEGHDVTYVNCMITMRKGTQLLANNYLFVLRKDTDSGRWKIFGWTVTANDK